MLKFLKLFLLLSLLYGCGGSDEPIVQTKPPSDMSKLLVLVNDQRSQGAKCGNETFGKANPIEWHRDLEQAAKIHSLDMYENGFFSHTGSDGSTISKRVQKMNRSKTKWRGLGENIARGQKNLETVLQDWMDSPGHCKNIMNKSHTHLGAAQTGSFWVQNFGQSK